MTPLCELAAKYGTDKLGVYTPFYDLLFKDCRNEIGTLLEVGIGTPETMKHVNSYRAGASLRMWRDYFPNATIRGVDIDSNAVEEARGPRIETSLTVDLRWKCDVIVDDGSHKPEDQINNYIHLSRLLDKRGLYIIEDVERYALEQNLLSPHLPEHTVIQHHHGKEVGRCILIRG